MPKKIQQSQVYKTESQLKEEALAKHAAEAEASAAEPKSELKKKRENFWYHYKWHTIASIFAAFLLVFFIKDMFFRTKPDVTVIVVSERFLGEYEMSYLTPRIEELATDYNGDGKIVIAADCISLPRAVDESGQSEMPAPDLTGGQQEVASTMKLMAVIAAGTDPIYLLDEAAYNHITGAGRVEDGDGDAEAAGNVFEAFSVPVGGLDEEAVKVFDGMRFYLRSARSDEAYHEYCRDLLKNIDRSWNNAPG